MKSLVIFLISCLSFSGHAQVHQKYNLGFEKSGRNPELPEGWFKRGDYKVSLDSASAHAGKYAALISSDKGGGSSGTLVYQIPANYKGRTITLKGFIKTEKLEEGFAALVLRIDGEGNGLTLESMQPQNISGSRDWQQYSLSAPYPEGAEAIYVSALLVGSGKAWFDDVSLSIDGKDLQTLKEKKSAQYKASLDHEFDSGSGIVLPELDDRLIYDLALLGKIWGFLKYHHPEVGKGNYQWDYELFRMLPQYVSSRNSTERDVILLSWIDGYGAVPAGKRRKEVPAEAFLKPDLRWLEQGDLQPQLKEKLKHIYRHRHQDEHYYIRMSVMGNPLFLHESAYANMPYPDEGFRLLSLFKYWNIIHYFFPYRHLMDKNWNHSLVEYIPLFINARNELDYELAAVQLIGDVQDSHANLWGGANKFEEWKGRFYPPFHLRFIEGKLVVTDYYNPELQEEAGLKVGDVITHIGGHAVEDIVAGLSKYYPASNHAARMRDMAVDLLRSNNKEIRIQFISSHEAHQKDLKLYDRHKLNMYVWNRRDHEKSYKLLEGNIGYVTLKTIRAEEVKSIKKAFKDTRGIIIDIRNYPAASVAYSLGAYFISSVTPFIKYTKASTENPGAFTFTEAMGMRKASDTYRGKLVVMVNEHTQSQAEYIAMALRAGDNTTIIGSTTAGADGDMSSLFLPGDLRTAFSGIGMYYPDGTETQRVGIVPDIEVKPSIEGIRKGKDEVLEKAILFIRD